MNTARQRKLQPRLNHDEKIRLLILAPAVLLILTFFLVPFSLAVYYSMTNMALLGKGAVNWEFIGFDNFKRALNNSQFWQIIRNTFVYLLTVVLGQQLIGFFVAYCVQGKGYTLRSFVTLSLLTAWVIPEVVAIFVFYSYLHPFGTVNLLLQSIGLPQISWLTQHPMVSIVVASIWRGSAFSMLMYQSALDSIPDSIMEAATIEGAGKRQTLLHITLPMIKGVIATTTIMVTLFTLSVFSLIFGLTGGGPGVASTTMPVFMYSVAFQEYQIGYGSAIAMFILVFGIILSLIYVKAFKYE